MTDRDLAREKAAKLLKKQGSVSSLASSEVIKFHKVGSMSTVSVTEDTGHHDFKPPVRFENTYQMGPTKKFPSAKVKNVIRDVIEGYLAEEKYEPELCRQMTKTLSEIIKARVKEMMIPRFKIICTVHIGESKNSGLWVGSRCLWDASCDTYSTFEYRNKTLFAIGTVFGIYYE
ncbi:dynein light chain Tctex-type 5-B-like [Crassostrea angulata]|uniref:Tctex1 domain-containing protein 1-B n=1 Tax=Magallana gigas TaxID=29159 RepID=K1QYA4_MAGGI|nr:dynein light chain Tctex-type 5-B-like [Crassostrea angulata]XP_052689289.1 dynein light chain Tctex-type 5-B-like [Crassostrea angulata]|eukprot:XP_011432086.1 PREDICTED: tctex1 domain-containing protein 1-B [Crassostrea gigas]